MPRPKKEKLTARQQADRAVLKLIRDFSINGESSLPVEFFFYADTLDAASNLAIELSKLNYHLSPVHKAAGDSKRWLVNGWTRKISMTEESIDQWSTLMCKLADEFDVEFDGWGTMPGMDEDEMKELG